MSEIHEGDRVLKYTGDYQLEGTVVSKFRTVKGNLRFVVEHEPGFLHIYSGKNIKKIYKFKPGEYPFGWSHPFSEQSYETTESGYKIKDKESALGTQKGGSHYTDLKIQPVEYSHSNNLGFCESNVVKYVTRWKHKNGIEDLEKAKHFIDLLIELESSSG